jgi:hypothetical protein
MAWVERSFLVYSNLFYLILVAHCVYLWWNHDLYFGSLASASEAPSASRSSDLFQPLFAGAGDYFGLGMTDLTAPYVNGKKRVCAILTILPEFLSWLALSVVSSMYHMCSDSYDCTRVCASSWDVLYKADFTLSFQALCMALLHTRDTRVIGWKWLSFGLCLILNSLMAVYVLDPPPSHRAWIPTADYYIILAALCLGLLFLRILIQSWQVVRTEIRQFRLPCLVSALLLVSVAIYFQVSARNSSGVGGNTEYWWKHSLWHIFTAFAVEARLLMTPPSRTLSTSPTINSTIDSRPITPISTIVSN